MNKTELIEKIQGLGFERMPTCNKHDNYAFWCGYKLIVRLIVENKRDRVHIVTNAIEGRCRTFTDYGLAYKYTSAIVMTTKLGG